MKRKFRALLMLWRKHLLKYMWWQISLFVIGVVSFITIIVVLFLPIGGAIRKISVSSEVPPAGSPAFLDTVSNSLTSPIEKGDAIQILNNGDAFLPALLTDIDNAKSSINFMVYIWNDGSMSDQVLSHLTAKAKEGVQVRVVLDAFGALHAPRKKFDALKEAGGKVVTYHSLSIAPWNLSHNHKRNHRRAIVIDGTIGYTGGIAVDDKWLGNALNKNEWRDIMVRTTGPMVQNIQGSFAELWASSTGEILAGPTFYPAQHNTGTVTYVPLSSTPAPDVLLLQKMLMLSMYSAQKKIYITTPYFLPDESMLKVLIEKARAGVDVRILVPNKLTDTSSVRYASHYYYEKLLEAGVKIYEYQPSFIHAKYIAIDGVWSIVGSANMDNRSRKINEEDVFGISNAEFGTRVETMFMDDIAHADEIMLSDWKKRNIWERIREVFALKFVKQY